MFAGMRTGAKVVKVGPLSFPVSLSGCSPEELKAKVRELRQRHVCIAKVDVVDEYEILGTMPFYQVIRLTMDDEADYQQICALRAETLYK